MKIVFNELSFYDNLSKDKKILLKKKIIELKEKIKRKRDVIDL